MSEKKTFGADVVDFAKDVVQVVRPAIEEQVAAWLLPELRDIKLQILSVYIIGWTYFASRQLVDGRFAGV